jgi:hypothetical protein
MADEEFNEFERLIASLEQDSDGFSEELTNEPSQNMFDEMAPPREQNQTAPQIDVGAIVEGGPAAPQELSTPQVDVGAVSDGGAPIPQEEPAPQEVTETPSMADQVIQDSLKQERIKDTLRIFGDT